MKGTIVATWLKSIENIYGKQVLEASALKNSWDLDKIITPLDDIEDKKIFDIVASVGELVGKDKKMVWRDIGKANVKAFSQWFPSYFERYSLKGFLMMMDDVHSQLTKMIPGAKPPRLIGKEIGGNEIELRYSSKRGLFDYFMGLLEGSADFFNEKMSFVELERSENGEEKYLLVRIKVEKSDLKIKSYPLNKILSLGFIKSSSFKISLIAAIIPTIASYFIFKGFNPVYYAAVFAGSMFSTLISAYIISRPIKTLKEDLEQLKALNFSENLKIKSNDEFEIINLKIEEFKKIIGKDMLFLKGGTDDLHSFVRSFSEIATKMERVSDGIASLVQEVANGAIHQAEETESSVYKLNQNIEQLNDIAKEQNQGKSSLEAAVENIEQSFGETKRVAGMISEVKDSFSKVNESGEELANQVQDIMSIVTTVASVADQTNLLALNAAIEAARAGEAGKGFAVVADEIRKLAENTKTAVRTINDSLIQFTGKVSELVQQINNQFEQLDAGSTTLGEVLKGNMASTERIYGVNKSIAGLIEKLANEAEKLSTVYENVHSLAAIAEENSASAQEMSANVSEYSDRIKELSRNVVLLEELTGNYKTELGKYKI